MSLCSPPCTVCKDFSWRCAFLRETAVVMWASHRLWTALGFKANPIISLLVDLGQVSLPLSFHICKIERTLLTCCCCFLPCRVTFLLPPPAPSSPGRRATYIIGKLGTNCCCVCSFCLGVCPPAENMHPLHAFLHPKFHLGRLCGEVFSSLE